MLLPLARIEGGVGEIGGGGMGGRRRGPGGGGGPPPPRAGSEGGGGESGGGGRGGQRRAPERANAVEARSLSGRSTPSDHVQRLRPRTWARGRSSSVRRP